MIALASVASRRKRASASASPASSGLSSLTAKRRPVAGMARGAHRAHAAATELLLEAVLAADELARPRYPAHAGHCDASLSTIDCKRRRAGARIAHWRRPSRSATMPRPRRFARCSHDGPASTRAMTATRCAIAAGARGGHYESYFQRANHPRARSRSGFATRCSCRAPIRTRPWSSCGRSTSTASAAASPPTKERHPLAVAQLTDAAVRAARRRRELRGGQLARRGAQRRPSHRLGARLHVARAAAAAVPGAAVRGRLSQGEELRRLAQRALPRRARGRRRAGRRRRLDRQPEPQLGRAQYGSVRLGRSPVSTTMRMLSRCASARVRVAGLRTPWLEPDRRCGSTASSTAGTRCGLRPSRARA